MQKEEKGISFSQSDHQARALPPFSLFFMGQFLNYQTSLTHGSFILHKHIFKSFPIKISVSSVLKGTCIDVLILN